MRASDVVYDYAMHHNDIQQGGSNATSSGRPVTPGMEVDVVVSALAFGGQAVARVRRFVIFVWGALPGETVRIRIDRVYRRHAEATLLQVIEPSPNRCTPPCRHFAHCGGCRWQMLDYEAQLQTKQEQVRDCFERLGKLSGFHMEPIRRMPYPWHYRNKVEFSVGRDPRGAKVIGFHPPGCWDAVMQIQECHLLPQPVIRVRGIVEEWLRTSELEPWNPRSRTGSIHHLTIRHSVGSNTILAGIASRDPDLIGAAELAHRLKAIPGFIGLSHTQIIRARNLPTQQRTQQIWGVDRLTERLGDLSLEFSLDAFFQTNSHMADVLYATAAEAAELGGNEVVWDLYSGTGSIALYLAHATRAVLGIEVVETAIQDARRNARANDISNAHFVLGDVRRTLKQILEGRLNLPTGLKKPDVVILDPPRGGLAKKVVARVAAARPQRVVYISCNPSTQAGDLALFAEAGYPLHSVTPVDMFPHTPHIEAVALLAP